MLTAHDMSMDVECHQHQSCMIEKCHEPWVPWDRDIEDNPSTKNKYYPQSLK